METRTPAVNKVLTMVLFTLSCAGLLLFLWLSFGGTIPFNAQGYRIRVAFPFSQELGTQADVRIAGVNVGKVVNEQLDIKGNREVVTLELDHTYAPIRRDARAILRTKTMLGETYVQITPGSPTAPPIPDGGLLSRSNVAPAVQLSQIFDAFDPTTRKAFQVWQQQIATAIQGNDQNLSNVLGNLPTFAGDATDILKVLNIEHNAVVALVQNGGTVFDALSSNQTALRNLITSGETTLKTTADNQDALARTIFVFPTFLTQSRLTLATLKTFSTNADPLMKSLVPAARNLGPTLESVDKLAPYLRNLFTNLDPLVTVGATRNWRGGVPGLSKTVTVLNGARPVLGSLGQFLEQLNPILYWLSLHQQLTSDFISNGAAGLAAKTTMFGGTGLRCSGEPCGHYLRQFSPSGPETSQFASKRDPNNRGNTYPPPLWLAAPKIFSAGGRFPGSFTFPAWDCPDGQGDHPASNQTPPGEPFPGGPTEACWIAPPLGPILGQPQRFPHVTQTHYSSR